MMLRLRYYPAAHQFIANIPYGKLASVNDKIFFKFTTASHYNTT